MSIPSGPDVEWVRTLKVGDRVGVAELGRLHYRGDVRAITPKFGHIKVAPSGSERGLLHCEAFRLRTGYAVQGGTYIRRYLVKPEDKP